MGGAMLLAAPAWAQTSEATRAVHTTSGRVRGARTDGVSRFLGIPYGVDTSTRRFQPPLPAPHWRGVRDCVAYGRSAPQPQAGGANGALAQLVGAPGEQPQPDGEDCLVLNVFTPDATPARKRPVMFWLHGGGFRQGSGSAQVTDGAALCRRGDVVVVSINHRLNAMGYLYLGALNEEFADSGNAGQFDQLLALQWVRDNIEAFGGDPDNVTIFGQSGGGNKVSVLLSMPEARGLFHKAIVQSGPSLRMLDRDVGVTHAERTLARLNIPASDVRRLLTLDYREIIQAAMATTTTGLGPIVDGRTVPRHPFEPDAPATAHGIPLIIGTTKDEATLGSLADPDFGRMTEAQVLQRFIASLGDRAPAALELFRGRKPNDPPTYWFTSMQTARGVWMDSIRLAERKAAQPGAPVFMYRVDWEAPAMGGALRSAHGIDTAFAFDNSDRAPNLLGPGPEPRALAAMVSQAWINFARSADPSQTDLAWPSYDATSRRTMLFDAHSQIVSDPDADVRQFFAG